MTGGSDMHRLNEMFTQSAGPAQYARAYADRLAQLLAAVDPESVGAVIEELESAIDRGATIYLIANGGSAAVAAHFVGDAVAGARVDGATPIRAFSLSDNIESLTALANDRGFEHVFSEQLKMLMRPGDLVLAMSVSGNSPNLVQAIEWANAHGGRTVAWTGFDGGRLAGLAHRVVHMPTTPDEYGPVEDIFSILEHIVMTYIAMKRGRRLHH